MGRSYIVEDDVEGYLSKLCSQLAGPVTGLLIGQSTVQRDFVVMTTRTPQNDESADGGKSVDKEWVSEHARQVSRMLPGGLSVLGVFIISESDAKDTLTTLRQLVFSVENLISSERLWTPADDDVTDCVTLHVNPKTRKTVCRTFDVKDPKSVAKPADWKYQSGVCSSWTTVSCCLSVDLMVPLPENMAFTRNMDDCLKEELKVWAQQIERGVCLIDGKKLPEDSELKAGQKKNVRQTISAQLLITPDVQTAADVVQRCGGCVSVRGAIHSRAFLHSNKPKAKLAEKLLKRDIVSTVATRVQMLLEEPQKQNEENKGRKQTEQSCLPRRVFCPVKSTGPLSVCDYQFSDEGLSEMTDRFKEMLDMDAAEEDLDATREIIAEVIESEATEEEEPAEENEMLDPWRNNYIGVAMATAVALLALAASIVYLSDV
ncbi:PREDICTED: protein odr-4 homolog isoform X1 [Poecilia mexicana]|uniref:Protein odr-4 homolog n=1 Tax=Poecilia mexicana TaxID=48701 RepID=A0A3B3WNX0_9TELE|nr:PREDICTED: protein odr-4 homolog isoform X1 [Poecilia mexicana]XP_014842531.1 PREDICTED: protein odr-4 homolog isoform X1 [Poecilia mexicana]XP_014842532.1 PREDICTED: protein odr-4 homolog isoform X1 [Poecilia mexicana]